MKSTRVIGAAIATSVVGLFLWLQPGSETFLVPQGYSGPVVVFYAHPQGVRAEGRWGARVYRIPSSGLLLLKDSVPGGHPVMEWAFVAPDGTRTPILPEDDVHPDFSITDPRLRMLQTHSTDGGTYRWIQAQVGRPSDPDSFGTPPHFIVDPIVQALDERH
jgi:uncharacterized protein DUF6843